MALDSWIAAVPVPPAAIAVRAWRGRAGAARRRVARRSDENISW